MIVVENGAARGSSLQQALDADVVLWSNDSAPAARNAGLRWVKQHSPGLVSFFDDDDLYFPKHLETLLKVHDAAPHGAVVGRKTHYLRTKDDRLLLLEPLPSEVPDRGYVLVQSMLACSESIGFWDERLSVEEVDVAWCRDLKTVAAPPEHFAFHNGPWDHLWAPPDREWPCRMPWVWDLGPYDPSVVSGDKQPSSRVQLLPTSEDLSALVDRLRLRKVSGRY